jgi:ABC-type dipeptide/oligopeptide/nickel transport system permease component
MEVKMDQNDSQELDLKNKINDEQLLKDTSDAVSESYNYTQSQLQWMNSQVSNLERALLLNNKPLNNNFMSNWAKVILSALAVIIPGVGQIVGIILGLVFVASDNNADKRSYGAALITVSVVVFILSALFWFIFAVTFGPQIYY